MIDDLVTHREALAAVCRRYGVSSLAVFGSAANGDFDAERSDVDLLVELDPPEGLDHFDAYFGLKEELEALLRRRVDLVHPAALVNPYFAASVAETREDLYVA